MSSPKDVIEIGELETSQARTSISPASTSRRRVSTEDRQEVPRYEPLRQRGGYAGLSRGGKDNNEDHQVGPSKLQALVYRLTQSVVLRRLLLYYLPPTLLLLIPTIITATVARNARIGNNIHMVGLFVGSRSSGRSSGAHGTLLSSYLLCRSTLLGSSVRLQRTITTDILEVVVWPTTAFYSSLFSRAATPILCLFDEVNPGRCDDAWIMFIRKFFLATIACTGLFLVQKALIHLLTVDYRKRQFKGRSEESERSTHILARMYEASIALYPVFCAQFASEDDTIYRSQTLMAAVKGGQQQSHLRQRVSKFYGADAIAETKARLHGKEVLKVGSSRSKTSRRRRLWLVVCGARSPRIQKLSLSRTSCASWDQVARKRCWIYSNP